MQTPAPAPAALHGPAELAPIGSASAPWSLARRVAFRFVFAYLALWLWSVPSASLGMEWLSSWAWNEVVPWVGHNVLNLSHALAREPGPQGDRPFDIVQGACILGFALIATLVWSFADARRQEYARLSAVLRVAVRYALSGYMLVYGLVKLFGIQFGFPTPEQLIQTYGESSPAQLMWNFMGYSMGYSLFIGGAEVLGALLLFFRRTTTLGALLVMGVMANVVALNFFYDVSVKLLSSHLFLMSVLLLAPDARRLVRLLVLNRPTEAVVLRTPFADRRLEWASRGVKALVIVGMLFSTTKHTRELSMEYGEARARLPLAGVWEVQSFSRYGELAPPLMTDAKQWRKVAINSYGGERNFTVRTMDDRMVRFRIEDDAARQTLELVPRSGVRGFAVLTYSRSDPQHLVLEGTFGAEELRVALERVDDSELRLVSWGTRTGRPLP